jgi:hypothetical protein
LGMAGVELLDLGARAPEAASLLGRPLTAGPCCFLHTSYLAQALSGGSCQVSVSPGWVGTSGPSALSPWISTVADCYCHYSL